jgi:hypothetical protein
MTNNPTNHPFEPFHVQSNLLKSTAPQGGDEPKGAGEAGQPKGFADYNPFGNWNVAEARWLAMPLFGLIYYVAQQYPDFRPLTVFVMLACLLFRMETRNRELAGVPLTLAAMRLAYQMTSSAATLIGSPGIMSPQTKASMLGVPWVPMFFAICIFYLPRKATATGKIMVASAICMLISGLLPGEGYVVIFAIIQYTLFVGVVVGLVADNSSTTNISAGAVAVQTAR